MNCLEIIEIRSARDCRRRIETQLRHLPDKAANEAKQQNTEVFNLASADTRINTVVAIRGGFAGTNDYGWYNVALFSYYSNERGYSVIAGIKEDTKTCMN